MTSFAKNALQSGPALREQEKQFARAFAILRDQSTAVLDSISLAQGAAWEERLGGSDS